MKARRLTPGQATELRKRYKLFQQNRPKALAREFDISANTLRAYLREVHKNWRYKA